MMMSKFDGRLTKLEQSQPGADDKRYALYSAEKLADMDEAKLIRDIARLQFCYEIGEGFEPDDRLIPEIDALVAAGNLDEAMEMLSNRPRPIESNLNEVK